MKLSALHQSYLSRRANSFRASSSPLDPSSLDGGLKSILWLVLHGLCCLVSLLLGFRFSRVVFFLLFSPSSTPPTALLHSTSPFRPASLPVQSLNTTVATPGSRVVVGRHGILIRPWPHPDPVEVMKAHRIIDRVQREQRVQYGVKTPRSVIAVTPTYVRTFQTLHLTGVMHSLMNVPYDLTWIVVEAGGTTNETAWLVARSGLRVVHVGFEEEMPVSWDDRHRLEARMRLRALRVVRELKLEGIVMFADDSNMHSMELFDEIQKVKWVGAVSVGILVHSGDPEEESSVAQKDDVENSPMPVQGPACNSSDQLVGWHTFNSLPYEGKGAKYVGDVATVLPRKLEWAGFVLNSRLLWKENEGDKPEWVKDLDTVGGDAEDIETPLSLLKDPSVVEPLGSCGRKILLWWLRVEARADSKFPARWIIDTPMEVTVPSKRTPWPDAPPELPSNETTITTEENREKPGTKTRPRKSKRSSRSKKKRESSVVDTQVSARNSGAQ
ncbi:beta-1,4-xylosyltransferase IRX14 [Rhododendron vialii]|uniref:beta-1,4-xylosyltransferase IRX14 n=1 Tax=Rhododendron vialii TaxID=182163 RepID=UPI00265DEBEA|nr:beta-1,4-xylosyltransferase IRX14 [Rhododendron vialii]